MVIEGPLVGGSVGMDSGRGDAPGGVGGMDNRGEGEGGGVVLRLMRAESVVAEMDARSKGGRGGRGDGGGGGGGGGDDGAGGQHLAPGSHIPPAPCTHSRLEPSAAAAWCHFSHL